MPASARENNSDLIQFIRDHPEIETVLDVGPGVGTYAQVLGGLNLTIDAVEVWAPYVTDFDLERQYNKVTVEDIREWEDFDYDLVIFGDVIEHMTRDEAIQVWDQASWHARYGMISIPIIHYPQGHSHGNPFEEHVQEHITPEQARGDFGPFDYEYLYEITGTFIKAF